MKSIVLAPFLLVGLASSPSPVAPAENEVGAVSAALDSTLLQADSGMADCVSETDESPFFYCTKGTLSEIQGGWRVQMICAGYDGVFQLTFDSIGGRCYSSQRPWP